MVGDHFGHKWSATGRTLSVTGSISMDKLFCRLVIPIFPYLTNVSQKQSCCFTCLANLFLEIHGGVEIEANMSSIIYMYNLFIFNSSSRNREFGEIIFRA